MHWEVATCPNSVVFSVLLWCRKTTGGREDVKSASAGSQVRGRPDGTDRRFCPSQFIRESTFRSEPFCSTRGCHNRLSRRLEHLSFPFPVEKTICDDRFAVGLVLGVSPHEMSRVMSRTSLRLKPIRHLSRDISLSQASHVILRTVKAIPEYGRPSPPQDDVEASGRQRLGGVNTDPRGDQVGGLGRVRFPGLQRLSSLGF